MPLFMSDSELRDAGNDVSVVIRKADAYIRDLQEELGTLRARNDATTITAEQNCALLEQKYLALSSHLQQIENEKSQLSTALEKRASDAAESRAQVHRLELAVVKKDAEIERRTLEVNELHKSKREILELLEQKSSELSEKNSIIKSYLDKIVALTDDRSALEAKLRENEAELGRSRSTQSRLLKEKELTEEHNTWLNQELTSKVNEVLRQRQTSAEAEAQLSSKLVEAENKLNGTLDNLKHFKEKVKDLEEKLVSARNELQATREDANAKEKHLLAEAGTASRLADLYKESLTEWSKKANELEGVTKALEAHLKQVEDDYKQKLEKEASSKELLAKELSELKERYEKLQSDHEKCSSKTDDSEFMVGKLSDYQLVERFTLNNALELHGEGAVVPKMPEGISATALAASLLKDGWSLTKMYSKYQEAADGFRHERQARKNAEAILERVLHEIEGKAEVILDERAEHARMIEAYSIMEEKLQQCMTNQSSLESFVRELKAELRKKERDYEIAEKENLELQHEITVLLKECKDIQLHFGGGISSPSNDITKIHLESHEKVAVDKMTYKDIHELVQQNHELRHQINTQGQREQQLKEAFDRELDFRMKEAAEKIAVVVEKSEEQLSLIETLKGSMAMYKRLYEEELKTRAFFQSNSDGYPAEEGRSDLQKLIEILKATAEKAKEDASGRIRSLEEEIKSVRYELHSVRSERDRLMLEASYAQERLDSFMKDFENQRNEHNIVLARNVEFSHLITEFQRKLRESSQTVQAAEERARKLTVEVSVLEREKEILSNAENRASEEVVTLSEKVHRLQATLDTIETVGEVRESSRLEERRRLEETLNRLQKEWAEAKQELQAERDRVQNLTFERDQTLNRAMAQAESMSKQLTDALHSTSVTEARALAAEKRCSDLEGNIRRLEDKLAGNLSGSLQEDEAFVELQKAREEIERLREELEASRHDVEQYKRIGQANEDALQQIESAHAHFRTEAEKLKQSLEDEVSVLKKRLAEMDSDIVEKEISVSKDREEQAKIIENLLKEISSINDDRDLKMRQIEETQIYINTLKEDLEKEHQNWRTAQSNYERQVVLQADTIQELSKTSQSLANLEAEVLKLRNSASSLKDEYDSAKVSWDMEKASLESAKSEAEQKFKDIDEQNKILLDRLEAMHIKLAEKERHDVGVDIRCQSSEQGGNGLQDVIRYLRRSKETADTEITLLKKERMRLQNQLETALSSAEVAQSALQKERESVRNAVYTDEEFRSLQLQVGQINLLRESNNQLREENQRNFEDCQDLRKKAEIAETELAKLSILVRAKEIEIDAAQKELKMQKSETERWRNRVTELLEKSKTVDVVDYENVKAEVQQLKERVEIITMELESEKTLVADKEQKLKLYEQANISKDSKLMEMEKRLQDASVTEMSIKADLEKFKKHLNLQKRRVDTLGTEKEELNKERQSLMKQNEDLRSSIGKRTQGDLSKQQELVLQHEQRLKEVENSLKEKESRIHILEKTLERERVESLKEKEELRKEKQRRLADRQMFSELAQKASVDKKKYVDEYQKLKALHDSIQEGSGSQHEIAALDEKAQGFFTTVDNLEDLTSNMMADVSSVDMGSSGGNGDTASPTPSTLSIVSSSTVTQSETTHHASPATATLSSAPPTTASTVTVARQSHRPGSITNTGLSTATKRQTGVAVVQSGKGGAEEKDQKGTSSSKTAAEEREKLRKGTRRIIRPRIEPAVETETADMETDAAADEGKGFGLAEAESQATTSAFMSAPAISSEAATVTATTSTVPSLISIRKRAASSAHPEVHEESSEHDTKGQTIPLAKKAKGVDVQEEKSVQPNPFQKRAIISTTPVSKEHDEKLPESAAPDTSSKEETTVAAATMNEPNIDESRAVSEVQKDTEPDNISVVEHEERKLTPTETINNQGPVMESDDALGQHDVPTREGEDLELAEPVAEEDSAVLRSVPPDVGDHAEEEGLNEPAMDLDENLERTTVAVSVPDHSQPSGVAASSKDAEEGFEPLLDVEEGEIPDLGEFDVLYTNAELDFMLQDDNKQEVEGADIDPAVNDSLEKESKQPESNIIDGQSSQNVTGVSDQVSAQLPESNTSEQNVSGVAEQVPDEAGEAQATHSSEKDTNIEKDKTEASPADESQSSTNRKGTTINLRNVLRQGGRSVDRFSASRAQGRKAPKRGRGGRGDASR